MIDKLVFAGDGHGGIVAFKSLQKEFESIEVITNDSEIISLFRLTDKKIKTILESDSELVVCAGYHSIIEKEILDKKTIINTHPSLLPKYRGMHGLVWGMLNFEKELGFTIHLMNEHIDDGDILEQFVIRYENQTSYEIMTKFDEFVLDNLGKIVKKFLNNKLIPQKQNKNDATWVSKRNIKDCLIDFDRSNDYIKMLFKALVRPYPLPMLKIKNRLYEVSKHTIKTINYEMHLGRVVNIEDGIVYIKILDGLLLVEELIDFESKKIINPANILKIGQRL